MNKDEEKEIEQIYLNTLLDMPSMLTIDEKHITIYPATIGTMHLTTLFLPDLEIDENLLRIDPSMELTRVATLHPQETARIIAIRTSKGKKDIYSLAFAKKMEYFAGIDAEDRAVLLHLIIQPDNVDAIMRHLRIDRELEAMRIARKAKDKDSNTLTYGAVSIYGSMIDQACEKYGWTYDYVVWGISYANLQLMLSDSHKELYLTDKERKRATILPHGNNVQKAENLTAEQIREKFYSNNK